MFYEGTSNFKELVLYDNAESYNHVTRLVVSLCLCGQIVVQVTDDLLSRASMTVVNSRPTLTINTSTAREHWLEGMLRHEIGEDTVYKPTNRIRLR